MVPDTQETTAQSTDVKDVPDKRLWELSMSVDNEAEHRIKVRAANCVCVCVCVCV